MTFDKHRLAQFTAYNRARNHLIQNPKPLENLERYFIDVVYELLRSNAETIKRDYDEASSLFPFWQNYPPDDRGRKPVGDQYPWIEVGEHAVGEKFPRLLATNFTVRDTGLPSGADQRFVLQNDQIKKITGGLTDAAWLFIDIKSVGPRDDFDHTVMSHNQISGDGVWDKLESGMRNSVLTAKGVRVRHKFHCSVPPLYILSDGTVAPVVVIATKPVYRMEKSSSGGRNGGQPLTRIDVASIPNGILLVINPGYLKKFPGLLFPGKDDKGKNPLKVRARISFPILRTIAEWRVRTITFE